jgi:hypothetical protein
MTSCSNTSLTLPCFIEVLVPCGMPEKYGCYYLKHDEKEKNNLTFTLAKKANDTGRNSIENEKLIRSR